jgi:hypothetical protein
MHLRPVHTFSILLPAGQLRAELGVPIPTAGAPRTQDGGGANGPAMGLGFGRIVASGIEAPNRLANMVWSG